MNALEDETLTDEALKGFYLFLASEKMRHGHDQEMIEERLEMVEERLGLSHVESMKLRNIARKYVTF